MWRVLRCVPEAWRSAFGLTREVANRPIHTSAARFTSSQNSQGLLTLERVAELIAAPNACVIVMAGAGVSVSAGIPDFRTPGSGLYDNLQDYGLPYPEAIFDLDFYQHNPRPFQRLCKELWPGNFQPTPTHCFLKLLNDQGKLLRCFTQNIDSLETAAGLPKDKVVAAHGNFDGAHVVGTHAPVPVEEVKTAAFGGDAEWAVLSKRHGDLVKPDIVLCAIAAHRSNSEAELAMDSAPAPHALPPLRSFALFSQLR